MKSKFISALLFGVMAVASTTTFVSCKDYDDDINDVNARVDDLTSSLTSTKAALESEISSLEKQLETANGKLTELSNTKADQADLKAAVARISSLESRLSTAESTLTSLNSLIKKLQTEKVDQSVYDEEVKKIYGAIESVETNLGSALNALGYTMDDNGVITYAVIEDLRQQIDALERYKERMEEVLASLGYTDVTSIPTLSELNAALKALQDENGNNINVSELKAQLESLSVTVDGIQTAINVLNVLLEQQLKALVFIPKAYYWGVEATNLLYLSNVAYQDVPAASYDVKEKVGYSDDSRYTTKNVEKVLSFAATYHMDPSSADLSDLPQENVTVLSNDLEYINTRAAAAGISVKNWNTTTPGILTVNLDVENPSLIKSVATDKAITNFATQVKLNTTGSADTLVTSDYATLYTKSISGLKLAQADKGTTKYYNGDGGSKISKCTIESNEYGHLMQTVHESYTEIPQYTVAWDNAGVDLRDLVAVHYTDVDGNAAVMSAEDIAANFDINFALTAYYAGNNTTDESAHAAIATDGYTFRPQAVTQDGKQLTYGGEQNRASEVGRTPVVRVTLTDKETGDVYDYGYIRIKIGDTDQEIPADQYITYTGKGYTYSGECKYPTWEYETTWDVTEYDLYKYLGLTREEFESIYGAPDQTQSLSDSDLDQYVLDEKTQTFSLLPENEKIGTASTRTDKTSGDDGVMSSTLKWQMTGEQAYKFFVTDKKGGTGIAVKYTSSNKKYADVYVLFKTGSDVTVNEPTAEVNFSALKNKTVWSTKGAAEAGVATTDEAYEFQVNTPTYEDGVYTLAEPFEQVFSYVFVGNSFLNNASTLITNIDDKTAGKEYAASKLTLSLYFDASNNGKEYKGVDGKTYVMSVSDDGLTLYARIKGQTATQAVAQIEYEGEPEDIDHQKIVYVQSEYAKALLNYTSRKGLAEVEQNTLLAIIGLKAVNKGCNKPLTLTGDKTFNVRFIRPINIDNTTAEVEDANTTELQTIDLMKLITFSDWRYGTWKSEYVDFYGIKGVKVEGVNPGDKLSSNSAVLTDQNGNTTMVPLSSVNGAIDFTYNYDGETTPATSTLTYRNYGSTTDDFKVQIPVVVEYLWGNVPQTLTITVKKTALDN